MHALWPKVVDLAVGSVRERIKHALPYLMPCRFLALRNLHHPFRYLASNSPGLAGEYIMWKCLPILEAKLAPSLGILITSDYAVKTKNSSFV